MADARNLSFRLRHGFAVQLRGSERVECVLPHASRKGVYIVKDRWLYDEYCQALTPGAPEIIDAWDIATTSLKGKSKEVRARAERQEFDDYIASFLPAPKATWKDAKRLQDVPRHNFLRIACTRCTRVRLDGAGFLQGEGRLGKYTIAELEKILTCAGCHNAIAIELENH